jgi:hypothetical protein
LGGKAGCVVRDLILAGVWAAWRGVCMGRSAGGKSAVRALAAKKILPDEKNCVSLQSNY